MKTCIIETDVGQLLLEMYYNYDKRKILCILYGTTLIDGYLGRYEEKRAYSKPIKEDILKTVEKLVSYHFNWKNKEDFIYWLSTAFVLFEKHRFYDF